MSKAGELKLKIEKCELLHDAYVELFNILEGRIQDALEGGASRIEWIVGPSRVGKTMMINSLSRIHPEEKVDGRRHIPVLVVPIPPNISPKLLPVSVMLALKIPLPPRGISSGVMFNRMVEQLRLANTRVLIFEEASHLVETGARVPPRAAADWFKSLADTLNLTLILFGVPRLRALFESNEQLRLRASARREFRPYNMQMPEQKKAFALCVITYADMFKRAGWPFELGVNELVSHCYLLSGGLVGVVSRYMQELASQMRRESERVITLEDCRLAACSIESAGHPQFAAFYESSVTPAALAAAHSHVLETNLMSLPRIRMPGGTE